MFIKHRGKTKYMFLPMTGTTVVHTGTLMAISSGKLIIATASTPSYYCVGVIRHTILAADVDYTTDARPCEVEVPVEMYTEWKSDVTSAPTVGLYYDIIAGVPSASDATIGGQVNVSGSTYDIAFCVGNISATFAKFVLNIGPNGIAKA